MAPKTGSAAQEAYGTRVDRVALTEVLQLIPELFFVPQAGRELPPSCSSFFHPNGLLAGQMICSNRRAGLDVLHERLVRVWGAFSKSQQDMAQTESYFKFNRTWSRT